MRVGAALLLASLLCHAAPATAAERRILVYTRNQIGQGLYVHDNIAASVAALKKLGAENQIEVEVSDAPAVFTDASLKRFKAVVFDNTNNEILDTEDQKSALQRYIRAGGGFVGIHSTSGAMRHWPWFWELVGGTFKRHAAFQTFTVKVTDPADPATAKLPASFSWADEYYFLEKMPEGLHVLVSGDLASLKDKDKEKSSDPRFGALTPLAWRHEFEGGRAWYTALGHKSEAYSDPKLTGLLLGGILWAMGETK